MNSTVTQLFKYMVAEDIKTHIFPVLANTYLGIGRVVEWGNSVPENVVYTTNERNRVCRNLLAVKKIAAEDSALVIPRIDWIVDRWYDQYDDNVDLFSHDTKTSFGGADITTSNTAYSNSGNFNGISVGDIIMVNNEIKQVLVQSSGELTVNSNFIYSALDAEVITLQNRYPRFANNFYVRNSKDQVFKCLFNNNANLSTVEPTIDIDGQLPENPYIQTADDYKWKYLYTIPYGLKQKFFTNMWMPVVSDNAVVAGAVDGRIDIVTILDSGDGYFLNNGESGYSNSLSIITVTGDGSSATVTAKVESGMITGVNIVNGGSGYTMAEITVSDPDQLPGSSAAVLRAVISPPGGHGSNPVKELGCYSVMTTVELVGDEDGTLPIGNNIVPFDFRQISLIRDPLDANNDFASAANYRCTTKLTVTDPGITDYASDETVFIGSTLGTATFSAKVVNWDSANNELFVNDMAGTLQVGSTLSGVVSAATSTILSVEYPQIDTFSGDILYIENKDAIIRDPNQTEQVRLVLSF